MTTIPQLAACLQTLLDDTADLMARRTNFVQRTRKLGGAAFVQTLVFGYQADPTASLSQLCQTAAALGVSISTQGLAARFTPAAAHGVQRVLQSALSQVIEAEPVALPLLQRFQAVYLLDSTEVALPSGLASVWCGRHGDPPPAAPRSALKLQVRLECLRGGLDGPWLHAGRETDTTSSIQWAPVLPGSLRVADLGYFDLGVLARIAQQGGYWVSRLRARTKLFDAAGQPLDLKRFWRQQRRPVVDGAVWVGQHHRLPCRLVAVRVPPEVVAQRRRRLQQAAQCTRPLSRERWALAEWTIYITNAPAACLSVPQVLVLGRMRWQLELLFKLWKTQGGVDHWRSAKPAHILCELYAKLLAVVVQHWILLLSAWAAPNRSWVKAAQVVRQQALHLAVSFAQPAALVRALEVVQRCVQAAGRVNRRRKHPSAFQLWLDPSLQPLS